MSFHRTHSIRLIRIVTCQYLSLIPEKESKAVQIANQKNPQSFKVSQPFLLQTSILIPPLFALAPLASKYSTMVSAPVKLGIEWCPGGAPQRAWQSPFDWVCQPFVILWESTRVKTSTWFLLMFWVNYDLTFRSRTTLKCRIQGVAGSGQVFLNKALQNRPADVQCTEHLKICNIIEFPKFYAVWDEQHFNQCVSHVFPFYILCLLENDILHVLDQGESFLHPASMGRNKCDESTQQTQQNRIWFEMVPKMEESSTKYTLYTAYARENKSAKKYSSILRFRIPAFWVPETFWWF